jgi:hypothetical protein
MRNGVRITIHRRPLEPDVIVGILPEEKPRPLEGLLSRRSSELQGFDGARHPDPSGEVSFNVSEEARGIHLVQLYAQVVRRGGDRDPRVVSVRNNLAIAVGIDSVDQSAENDGAAAIGLLRRLRGGRRTGEDEEHRRRRDTKPAAKDGRTGAVHVYLERFQGLEPFTIACTVFHVGVQCPLV